MRHALLQGLVNGVAISILVLCPLIYQKAQEAGQHVRCGETCLVFYLDMR